MNRTEFDLLVMEVVVAACKTYFMQEPTAGKVTLSEVQASPLMMECQPGVPALVESDFRKEARVTKEASIASHSRHQAQRESLDCMALQGECYLQLLEAMVCIA